MERVWYRRFISHGEEDLRIRKRREITRRKEVLTKICFSGLCIRSTTDETKMKNFESRGNAQLKIEKLQIILIMNKTNNNVMCAELGDEFANQLFSFLTFPLGSMLKFIGYSNSLGCMPNLYNSIQGLKINCFKLEEGKSMLISQQLPNFFGYNK
ncbi:hypothetical protein IEQ34_000660 [Dendrobium chrysotoxum]|uniref:Uncharacterized protein n=1 Tax=Dendrobium chrysotoxum TaxID=161865 RepID=A0AAV7HQ79_DENCH|nr:hypothetical protein IEQ34_000660 [Dendrobium chrysotoxum]